MALREKRLIVYDFETTGRSVNTDFPVQIAFKVIEKDGTSKSYCFYIKCQKPVDIHAFRIHNISNQLANEKGKNCEDIIKGFSKWLQDPDTILIGHNILNFDNRILNRLLLQYKCPPLPDSKCFDTSGQMKAELMGVQKPFEEAWGDFHNIIIHKPVKGLEHKLHQACAYFGIPIKKDNLHDALYDVECTYKVFLKQIESICDKYGESSVLEFLGEHS